MGRWQRMGAALVMGALIWLAGTGAGMTAQTRGLRIVDPRTAPQGFPQTQGQCRAVTPPGWTMRSGQYGDTADLDGPGGVVHASWGIRGIRTAMQAYYGDLHGPPEAAVLATASTVSRSQARYSTAPASVGGYFTARKFESATSIGTMLYKAYPGPEPGQYILSMFIAWADRSAAGLLPSAEAVMVSIYCNTRLRPAEPPTALPRPGGRVGGARSEDDSLKDYNAQLGSQWATSPVTGKHYLLDYASQWNSNGPDGPGYYAPSGNGVEKLKNGWQ